MPRGDLRNLTESKLDAFALGVTERQLKDDAQLEDLTGMDREMLDGVKDLCSLDKLT